MLKVRPEERRAFALFQKGFRPFFLLAALFAAALLPMWLAFLAGAIDFGSYVAPTSWHAHEMVFGFATAVVAGFLLTAAGNWTARETARGPALAVLAGLWLAGRVAMLASDALPKPIVAIASLAFVPALAFAVGRVIFAAKSRRNFGFPVVLAVLFVAQLVVHLDALGVLPGYQRTGVIVGVDLMIVLIVLVGGRVIPMFTRNATGATVRSYPWLDRATIAGAAALAVIDAAGAPFEVGAALAGAVAVVAAGRAVHWGARHTLRDPLLWVLHVGYAFVPIGFALRAAGLFTTAIPSSAATHALTVGAIGTLTIGMMARVSFGHTGRMLRAGPVLGVAFALVALAALVRIVGPLLGAEGYLPSLHASGTMWTAAFVLFLVKLGPVLVRPRIDGKPG